MSQSRPIVIAPSLLASDFTRLGEEVRKAEEGGADWLHVDVMDGHFVPNLSIGIPVIECLKSIAKIPLDVHIMIANPDEFAERYIKAGADRLTFHVEAASNVMQVIDQIHELGAKAGLALSPPTSIEDVRPYLDHLEMILVMTVHPGFGGQRFMKDMMPKIEQLRSWGYALDVQVDGGIDETTVSTAAGAGANVFVAGTAVFRAPDVGSAIQALKQRAVEPSAEAN